MLKISIPVFLILVSGKLIAGDDPCSATPCSLGCGPKITAGNLSNTDSGIAAPPSCGNYQGGDMWFSATVPTTGVVEIKLVSTQNGMTDLGMALYTAPNCSGPFTLISCNADVMPYIIEDGLTPGNDIYFRIWENGNDDFGDFEIEIIDPNDVFCLIDDAIAFNFPADTCMQTTNDAQYEKGCAWYRNTIDFGQDFDEWMILFLGANNSGADGMTVVFQNDPVGTNACGDYGEGMGASGIQNAVVIEVDTYDNGSAIEGGLDYNYDHIAVWTSNDGPQMPIAGPIRAASNGANVEDNFTHLLRVVWTASTHTMDIYFDGVLRESVTQDFVSTVFGSKNVFWGSTGATGWASNQQFLCPFIPSFAILPVDMIGFRSECLNGHTQLSWATLSEVNNDYFLVEKSLDGLSFNPVEKVYGQGNSTEWTEYKWLDPDLDGDAYYRLKQVDMDGSFEYSDVIHAKCESEEIYIGPNPVRNELIIDIRSEDNDPFSLELYNSEGALVYQNSITLTGPNRLELPKHLLSGIYFLKLYNDHDCYRMKIVKL